jgi:uncharacterized protein (DUF433 family)
MASADSRTVISAFTEDQVARLTGLTVNQLRRWDSTGFFKPALAAQNRRWSYSRLYSFKDVASLRVISALRKKYNVSLQHLRKVARELSHLGDEKWTKTELFVLNKRVYFVEADTKQYRDIVNNQYALRGMKLQGVLEDVHADVEALNKRTSKELGKVARSRYVNHNKEVVSGTRIPVKAILAFHQEGHSVSEILREYPSLTREDVEGAINRARGRSAA